MATLEQLNDPTWRLYSGELYKIITKSSSSDDSLIVPFVPNRAQRIFLQRVWRRNNILKARQLGFCLDTSTRILTADLKWVRIDALQPGDEVVAVDERVPGGRGAGRKMRTATIEATNRVTREGYKIQFADGRAVICTAQHPWLARYGHRRQPFWRAIDKHAQNAERALAVGHQVRSICKPWDDETYADGWFGGMIGRRFWEGKELPGKRNADHEGWNEVVSIEPVGMVDMIDLQTSTGTFIAEGMVSHNTTLVAIMWLDAALFSKSPIRCGIIAQDREAAEIIFRDKIKFAYDQLPEFLKQQFPISKNSASELMFAHNNSSIRVATSMRSGTLHRLHISEFGKICAKYPEKAREVVTGSIPAVPLDGVLVIESTAEGQEGEYYNITQRALAKHRQRATLTARDYRFHFFPWWGESGYEMDADSVMITPADERYFADVESRIGCELSARKRAWYVATREADFSGDPSKMWQEYPSYPDEAFSVSNEGCIYAEQMAKARIQQRITRTIPVLPVPVNTFWDIGRGDMTAIWFHQYATQQHRFVRFYEASGEDLIHYVTYLQRMMIENGYSYGKHYIPHECDYKRIGERPDTNKSILEMLEALMPGQRFEVVPRVTAIQAGIESTRLAFAGACFDETNCSEGLRHLDNYKKRWNKTLGHWSSEPLHDVHSHAADAFRQWGQVVGANSNPFAPMRQQPLRRRSGMAV